MHPVGISGTGGRPSVPPLKTGRGSKRERKRRLTAGSRWECQCEDPLFVCGKCGGLVSQGGPSVPL